MDDKNGENGELFQNIINNNMSDSKTIIEEKSELLNNKTIQPISSNKKQNKKLLKRKSIFKIQLFEKPDFVEHVLDKGIIDCFDFKKTNPELHKVLIILSQAYNRRLTKENELIFSFLTKIKTHEVIKSDLLESNLTWEILFSYIKPYIFGKMYNYLDTIYNIGNESNFLYVILQGKIGRFTLVEFTKSVSYEEYLLFICNCYLKYKQKIKDGPKEDDNKGKDKITDKKKDKKKLNNKNKNNKVKDKDKHFEEEEEKDKLELKDDEYIDEYLLKQIIDKNKDKYPLHSIDDIDKLNEIIFKIKLLSVLSEGKTSDAIDLFEKYKFPATFLGYDRVLERKMAPQLFLQKLSKNLGSKGRFYMKQLGLIPQKVKFLKFVKKDILEPYNFFGNFEIIDCSPKRKYTTRCESDKCILICIDKKMYSAILFDIQRNKREKEVSTFHTDYLFKNINLNYFTTKIFSQFKIVNLFKGDIIFSQEKNMNHFILVKEGIIEISLQNISFFELNDLIKKVKEILIISARKYNIDINDLFNFNMNIDTKTTIKFNIINELLHRKQNFIFSRSQKGFFGEYELFFGIPSILTGIVASDSCKLYFYDFDEFKNLNEETYILNESLKHNSFHKLKTLLKRMVNVYNSYWKRCHDLLNRKEIENEEIINLKNNEEMDLAQKKTVKKIEPNSPVKINPNLKDIFISHTTSNSLDFNITKDDDIENLIKLYLNKNNNNNINNKFFRTSLDYIKSKFKSQNFNKNRTNFIQTLKESQNIESNSQLITLNNNENEIVYKKSVGNIMTKINNTKLLKEFKKSIEAQRKKAKKEKKKFFLPPILKVPEKLYNYHIFKTETYKNNIDNSYSRDNSFNNSNSLDKSIKISPRNKGSANKIKITKIKTSSLKVAQFNMMRYRLENLQKRNPKLYMMNISNSQ